MAKLGAGLARSGVSKAGVDILRSGAHQGVSGVGLHRFLAMATLDVGVQGLACDLVGRVGGVGVASRCRSWREDLGLVFRGEVLGGDLAAGLVLYVFVSTCFPSKGPSSILTPLSVTGAELPAEG